MDIKGTCAFNIGPDGTIVVDGDHSPGLGGINAPFDAVGIACVRNSIGNYTITGPGIAWPDGWRVTIYRDDNGDNTIRVALTADAAGLHVACVNPDDRVTPMDIVYLLTLRVAIAGTIVFEHDPEAANPFEPEAAASGVG